MTRGNGGNDAAVVPSGMRSIDVGHECLMFLIERFFGPEVVCPEGKTGPCQRLWETIRFMSRQFDREEHLMRLAGYPDLLEHAAEHQELLARLRALLETLDCNHYDNDAVAGTLRDWCHEHVEEFDRPFGHHLDLYGPSDMASRS